MDLKKMKPEEKVSLCKKYYFGGFAFLPFLWLVNSIWFFKEAFFVPSSPEKKQIRYYVICSMAGASLWIIVMSVWATYFQYKRVEWGRSGDLLTYVFPRGEA